MFSGASLPFHLLMFFSFLKTMRGSNALPVAQQTMWWSSHNLHHKSFESFFIGIITEEPTFIKILKTLRPVSDV